MRDRVVVCCTPFGEPWSWFVQELTAPEVRWLFFSDKARYFWQHYLQRPNLNTPFAGLRAVLAARSEKASLLVSLDPRLSFWCALFCRMLRVEVEHLVFSFNFAELPTGPKRRIFSYAFRHIDRVRVHSRMEVALYHRYFGIPRDRIRVGLWCMNTPEVAPAEPLKQGRYACAIGGNARDYLTLLRAAEQAPEIPMVWVVRPENIAGLSLPAHVTAVCNIPYAEAMNYLQHSAFMVLPLKGAEVPCGHVTIISAMLLSKAVIATDSAGISDYIEEQRSGLLCPPADAEALSDAMRSLWADEERTQQLGEHGREFAERHCSEAQVRRELTAFLGERGLLRAELEPADELVTVDPSSEVVADQGLTEARELRPMRR